MYIYSIESNEAVNLCIMKEYKLKAGMKILFVPTNSEFELAKVTDKNVSWYVDFTYKSGNGINNLRMAHTSYKRFCRGIENGAYLIKGVDAFTI